MSAHSDIALHFAQECMGWKDAEIPRHAGRRAIEIHVYAGDGKFITKRFAFADLNAVMKVVWEWCLRHAGWFKLFMNVELQYSVVIQSRDCLRGLGSGSSKNACVALMSACLEAQRQMKEAA